MSDRDSSSNIVVWIAIGVVVLLGVGVLFLVIGGYYMARSHAMSSLIAVASSATTPSATTPSATSTIAVETSHVIDSNYELTFLSADSIAQFKQTHLDKPAVEVLKVLQKTIVSDKETKDEIQTFIDEFEIGSYDQFPIVALRFLCRSPIKGKIGLTFYKGNLTDVIIVPQSEIAPPPETTDSLPVPPPTETTDQP